MVDVGDGMDVDVGGGAGVETTVLKGVTGDAGSNVTPGDSVAVGLAGTVVSASGEADLPPQAAKTMVAIGNNSVSAKVLLPTGFSFNSDHICPRREFVAAGRLQHNAGPVHTQGLLHRSLGNVRDPGGAPHRPVVSVYQLACDGIASAPALTAFLTVVFETFLSLAIRLSE